mgnify:CR=1 FL=1
MPQPDIEPRRIVRLPGLLVLPLYLGLGLGIGAGGIFSAGMAQFEAILGVAGILGTGLAGLAWLYGLKGFTILEPNQAVIGLFFGSYSGTYSRDGFHYFNPFLSQRRLSLRTQTFETPHLKVNEAGGRPIEIGAVVTWAVEEPEKALLAVEDYFGFLKNRVEVGLREVAAKYPYESDTGDDCLRGHQVNISAELKLRIAPFAAQAGILVADIAITQLAYAPEIAGIMLVRQQAESLLAARRVIVEGAVSIAGEAIKKLEEQGHTIPEGERGRAIVNLLTVLASDRGTQPTVNVSG